MSQNVLGGGEDAWHSHDVFTTKQRWYAIVTPQCVNACGPGTPSPRLINTAPVNTFFLCFATLARWVRVTRPPWVGVHP